METSPNQSRGANSQHDLVEALKAQSLIHEADIAAELAKCVRIEKVRRKQPVIEKGSADNDLIFILAGEFVVTVGKEVVARCSAGEHVGEMALVDPGVERSATVIAESDSLVARVSEPDFSAIADRFPHLWRRLAAELAQRLRDTTHPSRLKARPHTI
jgi:CRP/FNR family transcriptional regulator, cyclic AMP receptor protein